MVESEAYCGGHKVKRLLVLHVGYALGITLKAAGHKAGGRFKYNDAEPITGNSSLAHSLYSSGVGRLVELQVSGEDLALRLALRSVDAGRSSGWG
jgi:hypothetical protein